MQQTETNYSVGASKRTTYIRIAGIILAVAVLVTIGTLPRVARVRAAHEAVGESYVSHPVTVVLENLLSVRVFEDRQVK
jgi:hypothetical protein